jgi:hypothetical protein
VSIVEGIIIAGEGKKFVELKTFYGTCGDYGWLQGRVTNNCK